MARQLLSQIKVEDLAPASSPVVVVDSQDSPSKTFLTMVKNNILCAPVLDKSNNQFVGFIDMVDVACFVVDLASNNEKLGSDYVGFMSDVDGTSNVTELAKRHALFPVSAGSSLLDAAEKMAKNHVQRVPVLDQEGNVTNLLTQSAIIDYLAKHADQLGSSIQKSLSELNFEKRPVISIDHHLPAIDAFRLMAENRVSGIAVLDSDKKLMANISARDLRSIQSDSRMFERLHLSTGEFVCHVRQANFRAIHPSICCHFDDSFQKIIMRLAAARIHRMYVVDESRRPISVISLHDVLAKTFELGGANAVTAGSAGL